MRIIYNTKCQELIDKLYTLTKTKKISWTPEVDGGYSFTKDVEFDNFNGRLLKTKVVITFNELNPIIIINVVRFGDADPLYSYRFEPEDSQSLDKLFNTIVMSCDPHPVLEELLHKLDDMICQN